MLRAGLFLVVGISFFYGVVYYLEYKDQTKYMNNTADCALAYAKENRPIEFINNLNAVDAWGNQMEIAYEYTKEYMKVTITSMGRDEKPDTKDDWVLEKFDYNKSYIAGRFTGQRAKDLAEGLVDGILEKDEFDDQK